MSGTKRMLDKASEVVQDIRDHLRRSRFHCAIPSHAVRLVQLPYPLDTHLFIFVGEGLLVSLDFLKVEASLYTKRCIRSIDDTGVELESFSTGTLVMIQPLDMIGVCVLEYLETAQRSAEVERE